MAATVQIKDINIAKLKGFKIIHSKKNNGRKDVKGRAYLTNIDMVNSLIEKAEYKDVL